MLVMMLNDQAQEIVRNSPEAIVAVWRKLLWEYGIRYGAMLQSLLKRRFGEHDETDLAREIESFERDIFKYEQQSSDLIHQRCDQARNCLCRHGTPRVETTHLSEYQSTGDVSGTSR